MGFLKNLFGRRNKKLGESPRSPFNGSRQSYYTFAHQRLPRRFFAAPDLILKSATEFDGDNIRRFWTESSDACGDESSMAVVHLVRTEAANVAGRPVLWITLPAPDSPTEAHFVALVQAGQAEGDDRYLLLERMTDGKGVLCEWLRDGRHRNHDRRFLPDMALFKAAVRDVLELGAA